MLLDLMKSATVAAKENLAVKPGEEVVVVVDNAHKKFGEVFAYVCKEIGANITMIEIEETGRHGAEPPKPVAAALKACDVFFMPTTYSLSHTVARKQANEAGARGATLPGITEEIFRGPMQVNLKELYDITHRVERAMQGATQVRVTTPNGTDVTFSLEGRPPIPDDGDFTEPGKFGNLPAGEVFFAPLEGTMNGTLVIDSLGKIITEPSKVIMKDGRLVEAYGQAEKLVEMLDATDENARNIAEFGIGTNPMAKVIGNILEDEKVLGTVHFAWGNNTSFGGLNKSGIHIDGIFFKPTIEVDGKIIMKDGKLQV